MTTKTSPSSRPHDGENGRPPPDSKVWQLAGACRESDIDVFFAPDDVSGEERTRRDHAAKAICARCPVRAACLRHAVAARESFGIWGGLTTEERQAA
jgi:WhiB family redox-sensing transcriptional regulator